MASTAPARDPVIGVGGHPLTDEQLRIIAQPPDRTRKWLAYAGCAKTSTSVEYAHAHLVPALYLAFNASIAADAKGRFPTHVETRTANAYAYARMGVERHRDRLLKGSMKPHHLDGCADRIRAVGRMTDLAVRRAIIKSINVFLISAETAIDETHLTGFPHALRGAVIGMVRAVTDRMLAFEDSNLPFTHDVYLKAFQLRGTIEPRFRYLIIDEAQDLNPVLIAIAKQSGLPCMVVGDPWQSIYRFRGAEQAMDRFDGPTLTLSRSFRFGPKVAAVANYLLRQGNRPPDHPVVGRPDRDTAVRAYAGSVRGRATVLSRTNMRLFESLVQIAHDFHVIGGIDDMLELVEAGWHLWRASVGRPAGKPTYCPRLSKHRNWEDVKDASEQEDDPELVRLVRIVDQYQDRLPEILADLRRRSRGREEDARFVVSTAHKAKGREWDVVILMDDFVPPSQLRAMLAKRRLTPADYQQEINLLYVACTRAIRELHVSDPLVDEILAGTGLPRM